MSNCMSSNIFASIMNCISDQIFISNLTGKTAQMLQQNDELAKREDKVLLSSLALEVDDIFFNLRKADQIVRRELNFLRNRKQNLLKKQTIIPINEEKIQKLIGKLLACQLLVDEYVAYMLENKNNSILKLVAEYNEHLAQRNAIESERPFNLIDIDEKLVHYIRQLGAMIYHLSIHLNLLSVLLRNASVGLENQQIAVRESQKVVTEYMVNEWGEQQKNVRFIEITIEGVYAIVTWAIEDLRGDGILFHKEGYWQILNISTKKFGIKDFENSGVPLDVAKRMLQLHHQKLEN